MAYPGEVRWPMADEMPQSETTEAPDAARLQRELEESWKQSEDLLSRLTYLQADLENVRKRAEREVDQAVRLANEGLVARLLPALDDLDAAVAAARGKTGKGLAMVRDNVLKAMREFGLEEIPAVGQPFDPYVHECLQRVNDEALPDGQVKEVVRKGYKFQMKVLRPAQVVVVKKEPQEQEGEPHA